MIERERIVILGVLAVLLSAWLGFLLHRSARFPGSDVGAAFGVLAAVLMLLPLMYPMMKRVRSLRSRFVPDGSLQGQMKLHVWAGLVAAFLAIVHTGHKFDSPLGVALTSAVLLVVVSGYAVRYLLPYVSSDIKEKVVLLQTARGDLDCAWGTLEQSTAGEASARRLSVIETSLLSVGASVPSDRDSSRVAQLADAVADLELAIRMDELLKRAFRWSLKLHIAFSVSLYLLLAMHVGASIYFGLRWLQ